MKKILKKLKKKWLGTRQIRLSTPDLVPQPPLPLVCHNGTGEAFLLCDMNSEWAFLTPLPAVLGRAFRVPVPLYRHSYRQVGRL